MYALKFKKAVALCAAVFFLYISSEAHAASLTGMPDWAAESAVRSIEAVWNEIKLSIPESERENTLKIVAEQLFQGYEIAAIKITDSEGPVITFKSVGDSSNWDAEINYPQLRSPVSEWFIKDMEGIDSEILKLIESVPVEALSWMDTALRDRVRKLIEKRVSGWDFSIVVRLDNDMKLMQISFTPVRPYVLSINPKVSSNALPVMFRSDLSAKLIADMSPIIGIPVSWAKQHEEDISQFAVDMLLDRNTVSNIQASVRAKFFPEQISRIDTSVDSESFFFSLKLAAYAGVRWRAPELWLTAGWRTANFTGMPFDIYSESFLSLDEFKAYTRLGGRFEVFDHIMIGAEIAFPGEDPWYRFWWDDPERKPYFWWRWNPDYGHNFAVGARVRDDLSIELHYDELYRDKFSVRGIFQF